MPKPCGTRLRPRARNATGSDPSGGTAAGRRSAPHARAASDRAPSSPSGPASAEADERGERDGDDRQGHGEQPPEENAWHLCGNVSRESLRRCVTVATRRVRPETAPSSHVRVLQVRAQLDELGREVADPGDVRGAARVVAHCPDCAGWRRIRGALLPAGRGGRGCDRGVRSPDLNVLPGPAHRPLQTVAPRLFPATQNRAAAEGVGSHGESSVARQAVRGLRHRPPGRGRRDVDLHRRTGTHSRRPDGTRLRRIADELAPEIAALQQTRRDRHEDAAHRRPCRRRRVQPRWGLYRAGSADGAEPAGSRRSRPCAQGGRRSDDGTRSAPDSWARRSRTGRR